MQGEFIRFYMAQSTKHHGQPLYEWLLTYAHAHGIAGGSAFRAIAGFGRHGKLHEEHFFELAGELPIVVEFFDSTPTIGRLCKMLQQEQLPLFYIRFPAEGSTI